MYDDSLDCEPQGQGAPKEQLPARAGGEASATDDLVQAAKELRGLGYALCRILDGEKRPSDESWQLQSCQPDDFAAGGYQIGLITGPLSGGIVCVDIDGIAPEIVDQYLPSTGMEDGRPGRARSHRYYRLTDTLWPDHLLPGPETDTRAAMESGQLARFCGSKNIRASREKGAPGVELKGAGTQVVVPPSVNPESGAQRRWTGRVLGDPVEISYVELIESIECMASDVLGWRKPEPTSSMSAPASDWRPTTSDEHRAQANIRGMGAAVEGSGGDQHTYGVCCRLLDYVDEETAWPLLLEWNASCRPPWDEQGLRRKLSEAAGNRRSPIGCLSVAASQPNSTAGPIQAECREGQSPYTPRTHADRLRDHLHPRRMIIEGLLPSGGIGAIVAQPGEGKTLLGIEVTRCIAAGEPFAGREVTQGGVLYICPDSPASTERRILAIPEEVAQRIYTLTDMQSLPDGWWLLHDLITQVCFDHDVLLVVIDTWDSARSHQDGGYAAQDGITEEVMRMLRQVAGKLGIAILVIHHSTRADAGRPRGSQVFDARADWIAVAESSGERSLTLRSTKVRDGDGGEVGAWRIEAVDVAGRPVPTLVARPEVTHGGPTLEELVHGELGEHRPFTSEVKRIGAALRAGPGRNVTNAKVEEALYQLLSRRPGFDEPVTEAEGPRGQRLVGRGKPPAPPETQEVRARKMWEEHPDWTVTQVADAAGCSKSAAGRARPTSHQERPT